MIRRLIAGYKLFFLTTELFLGEEGYGETIAKSESLNRSESILFSQDYHYELKLRI